MTFDYKVIAKIAVADVLPTVKDLEDKLNSSMASFGFSEKISFESEIPIFDLKSSIELTEQMKDLYIEKFNNIFQDKNIELTAIRLERSI